MTYEERQKWFCDKCPLSRKPTACGYLMRNMISDCTSLQNIMYGWELGQKDTLEEIEKIAYRRYSEDGDGTERNKDMIKLIKRLKGE